MRATGITPQDAVPSARVLGEAGRGHQRLGGQRRCVPVLRADVQTPFSDRINETGMAG